MDPIDEEIGSHEKLCELKDKLKINEWAVILILICQTDIFKITIFLYVFEREVESWGANLSQNSFSKWKWIRPP